MSPHYEIEPAVAHPCGDNFRKRVSAMADQSEAAIELCNRFYTEFKKSNLEGVVDLFADDAVVEVGAGGSAEAVAYSGVSRGRKEIRSYYQRRMARGETSSAPIRPECNIVLPPCIRWPWIVFAGEIRDEKDGKELYKGKFLHVWTVDAQAKFIKALCMHLDPGYRVVSKPAS
jgi:ketosteroid isomerase-like protein